MSTQEKVKAIARLLKDWKEIQDDPLDTVNAAPIEQNMFTYELNKYLII